MPCWQGGSPDEILSCVEALRKAFCTRYARAVRPAKLRPIGGGKYDWNQEPGKPTHRSPQCTSLHGLPTSSSRVGCKGRQSIVLRRSDGSPDFASSLLGIARSLEYG